MKKYYVLNYDKDNKLSFLMDEILCYPSEEWTDAKEGIITDIKILETWTDERSLKRKAKVIGRMVETSVFDFNSELSLRLNTLLVIGDAVLIRLTDPKSDYSEYTFRLSSGELATVWLDKHRLNPGNSKKEAEYLSIAINYIGNVMGHYSKEDAFLECIRRYSELKLDCAKTVTIFNACVFSVFYPGHIYDQMRTFYINKENECCIVNYGNILDVSDISDISDISAKEIDISSVIKYIHKHGIAVGTDSGKEIKGISEEDRKYFSTMELKQGGYLTCFKAEHFNYGLLKNKEFTDKVDSEITKWLSREGEDNPYYTWF